MWSVLFSFDFFFFLFCQSRARRGVTGAIEIHESSHYVPFNAPQLTVVIHARAFVVIMTLKGKLGDFFYLFKVFIGPKLRQVSIGNFHRKAPKLVKNQAKGSKIHQIRTKWHPTYCGNPSILSSDLLWESTNSVLRATVGIHSSI